MNPEDFYRQFLCTMHGVEDPETLPPETLRYWIGFWLQMSLHMATIIGVLATAEQKGQFSDALAASFTDALGDDGILGFGDLFG